MNIDQHIAKIALFLNENQGVLALTIFIFTILLGGIGVVFKVLRSKPELKIETLLGPTFVCVFGTGNKHGIFDTHQTGIALYLRVSNVGVTATNINSVRLGYHWAISPFSFLNWIRYRVGWYYLPGPAISLADFQVSIGKNLKTYPFLIQKGFVKGDSAELFLEPGRSTNGVVYFEQSESWGGCFPVSHNFQTKIKIVILDTFGKKYRLKTKVGRVKLSDARAYNRKFGNTFSELHGKTEPIELVTDSHGNLLPPTRGK